MHSPDTSGRLTQRKIGEILIAKGRITEEQLDEALELQKTDKGHLGKILVTLDYVTPDDLVRSLGLHLNVEYLNLSEILVDPEVLGIISEDVLLRHKALPLRVENGFPRICSYLAKRG
jgi:type IV pilus assembly protein PilB